MISLGQQSQLGIGIAIKLQNQFSGPAAKVTQSLAQMKNQANQAVLGAMRSYRNYATGIATAAGVASYAMYNMAEAGAEFQHKVNQIAIVGGRDLGKTRKEISDFALSLSRVYTRTPTEIAGAMFENIKAGITTGLEGITKYQIAVATATDEILDGENGVAFGLNSIMAAMNMSYGQFPRIANAVTAAANASQASVVSLNESMQYFANTAYLSNLTLEETLTILAKLSQSGIRGSAAGTAASNMLNYLEKSVGAFRGKKANKAWAMLGIDPAQIASLVNNKKVFEALAMVDQAASKLNTVNKKSVLNALFNIRGERALENLFGDADPTKSLSGLYKQITSGVKSDISMKQSKAMMNDLQGTIGLFKNQLTSFRIAFTEAVGPTLRIVILVLSKIVGMFTAILRTPVGKVLAGIVAVTVPLIGILFAFRAAALAATIALNTMAGRQSFNNLFGAGMGMFGSNMLGKSGIMLNRNGRSVVAAGQSINYGGKIYKGGQFLPSGFQAGGWGSKIGNFLGMGSLVSGTSWASKLTGFFGKALPFLGKIVGFGFKWLPVIGWVWTIVDILNDIFGIFKSKEIDPVHQYYNQEVYNQSISKRFGDRYPNLPPPFASWQEAHGGHDKILQTLNINIDGKQAMSKQIDHNLQDSMNGQFNLNLIH